MLASYSSTRRYPDKERCGELGANNMGYRSVRINLKCEHCRC